jgi:hypothetical protein
VQRTAATLESDRTTIAAWWAGERIQVSLPPGCNPSTDDAETGLANVMLRIVGSPQRFYALRTPERQEVTLLLMDQARADCLMDGGLLEASPTTELRE